MYYTGTVTEDEAIKVYLSYFYYSILIRLSITVSLAKIEIFLFIVVFEVEFNVV